MQSNKGLQQESLPHKVWKLYKTRWVFSKNVVLILIWNCLVWLTFGSPVGEHEILIDYSPIKILLVYLTPHFLWFVSALLSGWLAGTRFKRYNIITSGFALMWIGTILNTLFQALLYTPDPNVDDGHLWILLFQFSIKTFMFTGNAAVIVHLIQVGIDQISEPSSFQISAFVSWFVLTINLGYWLNETANYSLHFCLPSSGSAAYFVVVKMIQATALTVVLCMCFIFKKSLETASAKSNVLFTICHVLRYAVKHSSPEQRSALTYWEDEIPSRINLGKRKYGGPFTTEQVENVKAFFKILFICLTAFLSFLAYGFQYYSLDYNSRILNDQNKGFKKIDLTSCREQLKHHVFTSKYFCGMIIVLAYELLYPMIYKKLPTMLKRLGFILLIIPIVRIMLLILSVISIYRELPTKWLLPLYTVTAGVIFTHSLIVLLEFICAQSPTNMKNFFFSLIWCLYRVSIVLGTLLLAVWTIICSREYCVVFYECFFTVLSFLGFILYWIAAKKYKNRERDDPKHKRVWVEDAYYKYITAREAIFPAERSR